MTYLRRLLVLVLLVPATAHAFPADFDGLLDKRDFVIWRPTDGTWYVYNETRYNYGAYGCPPCFTNVSFGCYLQWGLPGDIPISGDFDRDGMADATVFRPSDGTWYIKYSSSCNVATVQFGANGDIPDETDLDNDGYSDMILYRPSDNKFYVRPSSSGWQTRWWNATSLRSTNPIQMISGQWGNLGSTTDLGTKEVMRYSTWRDALGRYMGQWSYLQFTNIPDLDLSHWGGYYSEVSFYQVYGEPANVTAVPAQFGQRPGGALEFVWWNQTAPNYFWYIPVGNTPSWWTFSWGLDIDKAAWGDFDGDGIDDITVWRNTDPAWQGTWFIRPSTGYCPAYTTPIHGVGCYKQWGLQGDIPVN